MVARMGLGWITSQANKEAGRLLPWRPSLKVTCKTEETEETRSMTLIISISISISARLSSTLVR